VTRIGIAGAGAWGLALARAAERAGSTPAPWSRRGDFRAEGFAVTGDDAALSDVDMLLLTIPAQELAGVAARLAPNLAPDLPLVICAKGIARPGAVLLSDALARAAPGRPIAILSGPTFAAEIAKGLPAAVTIACHDATVAHRIAHALGGAAFRPYVSTDPVGVQLGGAAKNVIAIACGIVAGRQAGENARAALMTRGLAEMARLGRAMGARPETFAGLAGLGDLSLTATSATSRNFRLGVILGEGQTLAQALARIDGVVEGVATAQAVVELAARHGVDMPISAAVAAIVEQGADIGATIAELLARPFKSENAESHLEGA
jgi:glycerol-3-phosphate dehydrogenase (NAD(P)+)